ncbi:MAG: CCA tRNA nucleotidyltransferase [Thaumarchaeota archaeon]|nr:CCA tRNA nucleotidyltransferase [Nitrososphaerota archaeon]
MSSIITTAKKLVTPTPAQEARLGRVTELILKKTETASKDFPQVREVMVGGSFAKGTWLPEEADIDIFVKISPEVDDSTFEEIGLQIGRRAGRGYPFGKKYAQHPYTEATIEGIKFNIVPCFDVKPGAWRSAADRSLYHVKFVSEKLDDQAKLQVRLLKWFMRSVGVYGAEIEMEGFSGYCAEVLVYNHGGFEQVLRYFAGLRPPSDGSFLELKDPIDQNRNLAKAISLESISRMILASRAFVKEPKLEFFKKVRRRVRAPLRRSLFVILFQHPEISEDTLWGELKKSTRHIANHLRKNGFPVLRARAASNNKTRSAIIILPENESLPELEDRTGPGVELANETRSFIRKNRQRGHLVWAGEDGRVHILSKRKYSRLDSVLREILNGQIAKVGASADVVRSVIKTGRLLRGERLEREMRKEAWLSEGVHDIIADTIGTDSA